MGSLKRRKSILIRSTASYGYFRKSSKGWTGVPLTPKNFDPNLGQKFFGGDKILRRPIFYDTKMIHKRFGEVTPKKIFFPFISPIRTFHVFGAKSYKSPTFTPNISVSMKRRKLNFTVSEDCCGYFRTWSTAGAGPPLGQKIVTQNQKKHGFDVLARCDFFDFHVQKRLTSDEAIFDFFSEVREHPRLCHMH